MSFMPFESFIPSYCRIRLDSEGPFGLLVEGHRNQDLPLQVLLLVLQFFFLPFLQHVGHGLSGGRGTSGI